MVGLLGTATLDATAQPQWVITTEENVPLRTEAWPDAPVIRRLQLGTELMLLSAEPSYDSFAVLPRGSRRAWVSTSAATPFDANRRAEIVAAIAQRRLPRDGEESRPSFASHSETVELLERTLVLAQEPQSIAQLTVVYLNALRATARSAFERSAEQDTWLDAHSAWLVYNEPGGNFLVNPGVVRELFARYRDTPAADDIAWFFATNDRPGECEGDLACYTQAARETFGQYLEWQPAGLHVDAALDRIATALDSTLTYFQSHPRMLASVLASLRCERLLPRLDELNAAVAAASAADRTGTLAVIERYRALCTN